MIAKPMQVLFDAMHHGKYEFTDFIQGDIERNYAVVTMDDRVVYQPNKKLRAYHRFIAAFICNYLDINERVVHSYRKGFSTLTAISAHAKNRAFFHADIDNFFASITRDLVKSTLVDRSAHIPITDFHKHVDRILALVTADNSLPVGFATSPSISNSCLTGFDHALELRCSHSELTYTRYADDIVISGGSREALLGVKAMVEELLGQHFGRRLTLNTQKSKLVTIGRKIKLLGIVILPSGRVTIDRELKARIEVLVHFYVKDREKFLSLVDNDLKGGVGKLSGYINHVNSIDKIYLNKLRKKFGSTVIDSFMHRSAT